MNQKNELHLTLEQGEHILKTLAESISPDGGDDLCSWEVWEVDGTKCFATRYDDRISLMFDTDTGVIMIGKTGGHSDDFELPVNEHSVQIIDALYTKVIDKRKKSLQSILKIFNLDTHGKG